MQLNIFNTGDSKKEIPFKGVPSSHPCYYSSGGRILSVDEIIPLENVEYSKRVHGTIEKLEEEFKKDIESYNAISSKGNEVVTDYDKSLGYSWVDYIF